MLVVKYLQDFIHEKLFVNDDDAVDVSDQVCHEAWTTRRQGSEAGILNKILRYQ